jgi:4-hydroxythreonine-4-phosphate dehydrogenase
MSNKRIAITTGDSDGIGFEVAAKALCSKPILSLSHSHSAHIFLFRSSEDSLKGFTIKKKEKILQVQKSELERLSTKYQLIKTGTLIEAIEASKHIKNRTLIFDICSTSSPADWVVGSGQAALKKEISGLCTAPLSKTLILESGYSEIGHTELLKSLTPRSKIFMTFLGSSFNVALLTAHIPTSTATKSIDYKALNSLINNLQSLNSHRKDKRPIAVLGMNPHAGEGGIIGRLELKLSRFIESFGGEVVGPLVPDAAFLGQNLQKYSFFVALYHDQGLIPFKMAHGQDCGVHLSLGLPFVRTSVDHGTAKDIFGKNKANPGSMVDALSFCIQISKK